MSQTMISFQEFVGTDGAELPLPGSGATWRRFSTLAKWAAKDLSAGRLCEGHADALAILYEAGMKPVVDASYGVWASRSSVGGTVAERAPGGWRLSGSKAFCSGSGMVERALVTADSSEGYLMFDVAVGEHVSSVVPNSWPAVGMADSKSETLVFGGPVIGEDQRVGPPDFYTHRPGFWFGAAGVAACWYGGAVGLVNNLTAGMSSHASEHVLADLGEAGAALEMMNHVLRHVATTIDGDPLDRDGRAHFLALVARQVVHDSAQTILARVASAGGARPLCLDPDQARRAADLYVYLAQHHGRADAAELGRMMTGEPS
jgi:alkylation response protein AidB-like acyl-CoA dehydrogenase